MRSIIGIFLFLCTVSCETGLEYSEYKSIDNHVWNKDELVAFSLPVMDTLEPYNIFINIRNTSSFAYSNLFLIASITDPEGGVVKDTLEYAMALPDGTWLGTGNGGVKENKLWYKEELMLSHKGVHTVEISHAMRKNGSVSGIIALEGITDVGLEVAKSNFIK